MGRPKTYKSAAAFGRAVDKYFEGISRTVTMTEPKPTGRFTQKGYPIYEETPILNDAGEEIRTKEFVVPPSITALCLKLGISKQTFATYAQTEGYKEHCERAKAIIEGWLESQLATSKNPKGVEFNLTANFGWKNKMEISTGGGIEGFIRSLPETTEEF